MGYLRSCYSTKMRFFNDDVTHLSTVRYFFASPLALVFTGITPFNSRNYIDRDSINTLGEVDSETRVYSKGEEVPLEVGLHFCGLPEVFENGQASTQPGLPPDQNGNIACCTGIPVDPEKPPLPAPVLMLSLPGGININLNYNPVLDLWQGAPPGPPVLVWSYLRNPSTYTRAWPWVGMLTALVPPPVLVMHLDLNTGWETLGSFWSDPTGIALPPGQQARLHLPP